jgi:diketogulonate reductase-like aldo/keto reductase
MSIPIIDLPDSNKISQIGLGLWKVKDQAEFNTAFEAGLKVGYRHFDSAQAYDNEQFLGEAWKKSGIKREELFLTTKIMVNHFGKKRVGSSFAESLEKIQSDYVDLLLLHFPVTLLRKNAWLELEKIKAAGGAKSIGVSNYTIRHLEEMKNYANELPAVNQVELHVFLQQPELIEYCRQNNIAVEAYSPLAHAKALDEPVIKEIAEKHCKTYAQIMLRWLVEKGLIILPKSVTPSRIKENFEVFDFELDKDDLAKIAKLDRDMRTCWSPVHVP